MNSKLLVCLVAGALGTSLALASPGFARGGGGGGGGGGMVAVAGMAVADAWRRHGRRDAWWRHGRRHAWRRHGRWHALRRHGRRRAIQRRPFREVRLLRMPDFRRGFQGSHSTGHNFITSITASIALRSLARPTLTPTPPTTAAGAGRGRHMDCSGSTSAATTATSAADASRSVQRSCHIDLASRPGTRRRWSRPATRPRVPPHAT